MRRTLWLACIIIVAALISLPIAFTIPNSQRESVVITEKVISGDPEAAAGVTVEFLTHWEALALWNTRYTIGSGETVTEFTFEGDGVTWPKQESVYFDINIPLNFGTASVSGYNEREVDLVSELWLPEIMIDVASRTKVGEKHTELITLAEYYEYYPLELSVRSEKHNMSFYSNGIDYFSDFFHVRVPEDEIIEVSITKGENGAVTDAQCRDQNMGLTVDTAYAFGEEACFFTYSCTEWETGERIDAEENAGIFLAPYVEENRRFTIPGHVKKVCDIPKGIVPAEMLWDEERGELYLAAKLDEEYRLYIYSVAGEKVTLKQELVVLEEQTLEEQKLPAYREMTLEKGGILLKWNDGNFSFVAETASGYELWCNDIFVADVQYLEDLRGAGNLPIDVGYEDEIIGYEHALAFDGNRLVLASYDGWDSVNVTLAVYNREGQVYCGQYHHSAEADLHLTGIQANRIYAQGAKTGSNRRRNVDFQPLNVWFE